MTRGQVSPSHRSLGLRWKGMKGTSVPTMPVSAARHSCACSNPRLGLEEKLWHMQHLATEVGKKQLDPTQLLPSREAKQAEVQNSVRNAVVVAASKNVSATMLTRMR